MIKNILFRADSSSVIGTGHIIRDITFAKKYKKSNITFASRNLNGNINYKIKENHYKLEILNSSKISELIKLIKKLSIDLLIIDNYSITYKHEKRIKRETNVQILSFDDTYEKHYCDILINHNIGSSSKKYKDLVPKRCKLLCGKKHTILRDEFYKEKNIKYKKSKNKNIFIAMGGADHSNINIDILNTIDSLKRTDIKINIVTTDANQNLKRLKQYCKNKSWINLEINSNKIAKLMNKSDLCIISPSVTANEVCYLNKTLLAIKTASNQIDIYKYLKTKNYPVLKEFNHDKLRDKLCKIL